MPEPGSSAQPRGDAPVPGPLRCVPPQRRPLPRQPTGSPLPAAVPQRFALRPRWSSLIGGGGTPPSGPALSGARRALEAALGSLVPPRRPFPGSRSYPRFTPRAGGTGPGHYRLAGTGSPLCSRRSTPPSPRLSTKPAQPLPPPIGPAGYEYANEDPRSPNGKRAEN